MVPFLLHTNVILILLTFLTFSVIAGEVIDDKITGARIESCKGCRLNRLPDVKKFVFEDVPLFNDVVFKPIPGASPELVYLNNQDQEIDRIDLAPLTREECNSLLTTKGFSKRNPDIPSIQRNDL